MPELVPQIVAEDGRNLKVFTLTVKDVFFEIYRQTDTWLGFNGRIPGPTIRVMEGDRTRIILTNETRDDEHTLHVHEDAFPMEGHVENGVVTEHEGAPPVHRLEDKKPAIRDWYPETHESRQDVYDGFTINGRSFPFTEPVVVKQGKKVRIRFINVGYQPHFMHTHSHKFVVVARDGSYVNEPQKRDTVQIGPGQRIDIILSADNPGIWPFHCHRLDHIANEHIYPGGMMTFIKYEN